MSYRASNGLILKKGLPGEAHMWISVGSLEAFISKARSRDTIDLVDSIWKAQEEYLADRQARHRDRMAGKINHDLRMGRATQEELDWLEAHERGENPVVPGVEG